MTSHTRLALPGVVLAWMIAVSVALAQQTSSRDAVRPPTTGTASVAGTVVADDQAHSPIPHAVVTLWMSGSVGQRTTSTDEAGRYLFPGLPAAVYTLDAARGAYLRTTYGALAPGAPPLPIPLKDGQRFVATPIVLVKGSVIVGRVTAADGRPMANARVAALRLVTSGTGRQPDSSMRPPTTTDSRGLYRIYGLAAGDYVVNATSPIGPQSIGTMSDAEAQWAESRQGARATAPSPPPPPSRAFVTAPTYFPGVADLASAAIVSLSRAEEREGIDISVLRVGASRLTGVVYGTDGQPVAGALVLRSQKHATGFAIPSFSTQSRSGTNGSFTMNGVTPGDYVITARASAAAPTSAPQPLPVGAVAFSPPSGPLTLWGQAEVANAGDDIDGVAIHLQPGMTISGSIVFDGTASPPTDLSRFQPRLVALDNDTVTVSIDLGAGVATNPGTFSIDGVTPGQYLLTGNGNTPSIAGSAPVWIVKSAIAGGRDLLDAPFEVRPREDLTNAVVTYTDRHTTLDGHLTDAAGQPVSQFRVMIFTTMRERWAPRVLPRWMASVRAGVDGSFRVVGLPAGEYYVCAFVDSGQVQTPDDALLTSLVAASIKITLADGETHTQTFKVGG